MKRRLPPVPPRPPDPGGGGAGDGGETPSNSPNSSWVGCWLLLVSLCWLCYWNSLLCGFVFDDVSAVRDNRDLRPSAPLLDLFLHDFWGTPMDREQSHKSYRPLTVLTFRANAAAHGADAPAGFHLVNLLLHCLVCVLYHR